MLLHIYFYVWVWFNYYICFSQVLSSKLVNMFYSHLLCINILIFSCLCKTFIATVFYSHHFDHCKMVYHFQKFKSIVSIIFNESKYLTFLVIWVSCSVNFLFMFFAEFSLQLPLLCWFIEDFCELRIFQTPSYSLYLPFNFVMVCFVTQKFKLFM